MPALGYIGVGTDHEAVREAQEHRAPGGIGRMIGAEGEIRPEVPVLREHFGHALGPLEACVRPENARLRPLPEEPFDRVHVGMRVQKEIVLARELDHAAHHRQVGIRAVEMELADPYIFMSS